MKNESWKKGGRLLMVIAAATAVICLITMLFYRNEVFRSAFRTALSILMPFIYGFVIAYLLLPVVRWIERLLKKFIFKKSRGKSSGPVRLIASLLALASLLACLVFIVLMVLPQLIESISGIVAQLPESVEQFQAWLSGLASGETSTSAAGYVNQMLGTVTVNLENYLQNSILPMLESSISEVTSSFLNLIGFLKNFGLGLIISLYFLLSWEQFAQQAKLLVYSIFPERAAEWIREEMHFVDRMFNGFIMGKIVDSIIVGILCFVCSVLLRFPYAALISVVVGVTNVIPFFGPYLGAVPSVLLILTESPVKALMFLVFIIVLQQLDGNVIGPRIIGDKLGLSGFWILFSILVFSSLWGLVGMLVGAPVFAVLYDLIRKGVTRGLKLRGKERMEKEYREKFHGES